MNHAHAKIRSINHEKKPAPRGEAHLADVKQAVDSRPQASAHMVLRHSFGDSRICRRMTTLRFSELPATTDDYSHSGGHRKHLVTVEANDL